MLNNFLEFQNNYSFIQEVRNKSKNKVDEFRLTQNFIFIPTKANPSWGGNGVTFHDFLVFRKDGLPFPEWKGNLNWNPSRKLIEKEYNFSEEYHNGETILFKNKKIPSIKVGDTFTILPHLVGATLAYEEYLSSDNLFGYCAFEITRKLRVKDIYKVNKDNLYIFESSEGENFYSWNHTTKEIIIPLKDLFIKSYLQKINKNNVKNEITEAKNTANIESMAALNKTLWGF